MVALPKFLRGEPMEMADGLLMFVAMLTGPSIAGVAMTGGWMAGIGLQDLFAHMRRWRVGWRWYAAAFLISPALILAVLIILSVAVSLVFALSFVAFGIAIGLLADFIEEIGRTGYAFRKLELRHGALVAALCPGLLHSTWHVLADYLGSLAVLGVYWLPRF